MSKVKSGVYWVKWANVHAKNSTSVVDLVEPFQTNIKAFIKALEDAGAKITIFATKRPKQRAYLFHWAWKIGLGNVKASDAGVLKGVDIEWNHGDAAKSKTGAQEMIDGFGLAVPPDSNVAPSLNTNHAPGTAIDMSIIWNGDLKVKNKDGSEATVPFVENPNKNTKLHAVGETYGVKKLKNDKPHWSLHGN